MQNTPLDAFLCEKHQGVQSFISDQFRYLRQSVLISS